METDDLHGLLGHLSTNIDDLEISLAPLLSTPLSQQTSKLPLLDQAKLHTLAVYAIESLLFSSLRLNGVDAKSHPVFQELGRVKEYFQKIKVAETGPEKRPTTLDREAAGRFIKHGLAGNEKFDRERKARVEGERAGAKRKLEEISSGTHMRFDGRGSVKVVKADDAEAESDGVGQDSGDGVGKGETVRKKRKGKKGRLGVGQRFAELAAKDATEDATNADESTLDAEEGHDDGTNVQSSQEVPSKRSNKSKRPKGSKEALESLLEGALDSKKDKKTKKRKKSEKLEDERAAEMK